MFLQDHTNKEVREGWIEVICGGMFSGKTEKLIKRLKEAQDNGAKVAIFKPAIETRYHATEIVSHNKSSIPCTPVTSAAEIAALASDADVVGIDEAQFFDEELTQVCEQLANQGSRVILAGLDVDFKRVPFGPMPQLMAVAEYITKLNAVCADCGGKATNSFRTAANKDTVLLGEKDVYKPLCRNCYNKQA